jgi:hypothetical protein
VSEYPVNTWEQVGPGGVFVSYSPTQHRGSYAKTQVIQVGRKTDPKAPWYDNGNKSFVGQRKESLQPALDWASAQFGIKRWRRNSMGDYIDADKEYLPLRQDVERRKKK